MIQVDKNNEQGNRVIKFKINHPKLSHLQYLFQASTPWKQVQSQLTNNMLSLFNNRYFLANDRPIKYAPDYLKLISEDNRHYFQLQPVFQHYKYASAIYHFKTIKALLANPEHLYYLIKPVNKEIKALYDLQTELIINQLVPQSFQASKWTIDQIVIPNYKNQLWEAIKKDNFELVQLLQLSGFNPPPKYAQFAGDLFYIHLKTLQNVDYHITACPLGFYLNQSKISSYNPSIQTNKNIFANLMDLIASVSDKFNILLSKQSQYFENSQLQKLYRKNHNLISSKVQGSKRWLDNPESQHHWNGRRQNIIDFQVQEENNIDWNQQFLNLDIESESSRQKHSEWTAIWQSSEYRALYNQFKEAAIQGVKKIVQGRVQAINYMDEKKKHIYITNKIFFSTTFENPLDHSLPKEEDAVPSDSSSNTDLNNLQLLWNLHPKGIRLLHCLIINYRGNKIVAQTIIPGLLSSDINSITQYGTLDGGKTVQSQQAFTQLLAPICQQLHLDTSIQAFQDSGNVVKISISPQIKGIKSIGGQNYLCDIQKLSPRDLNYIGLKNEGCVLRQKIINQYIEDNRIDFRNHVSINTNIGTSVKFKETEDTNQQEQFLMKIAKYMKDVAIVKLINSLKSKNTGDFLTDSQGISVIFHELGVNMRYLGFVQKHQLLKQNIQIRLFLKRVIFVRSLKHLFRGALRHCSPQHIASIITHLLNCLFSRKQVLLQYNDREEFEQRLQVNESKKKKKKKNNKQQQKEPKNVAIEQNKYIKIEPAIYLNKKPQQIWEQIKKIAFQRFDYQLQSTVIQFHEKGLFHLAYQKYVILRDICSFLGLVLQKKQYFLKEYQKQNDGFPFHTKNVLYFLPIPKLISFHSFNKITSLKLQADRLFTCCSYKESLSFYHEICDLIRQQKQGENILCYCLGQISRIQYMLGNIRQAIITQAQNLMISQRLHRQDSLEVIKCYSRLGLYCMGVDNRQKSIWFLYKGLYLMLMSFGQTYPDILVNFANIAKVHQLSKQIGRASACYLKAIQILSQIYSGKYHVNISFCYSSLASLQYELGQFKKSFQYQNEAVSILQKILNPEDQHFLDATRILKMYRQILNTKAYVNRPLQNHNKDRKK